MVKKFIDSELNVKLKEMLKQMRVDLKRLDVLLKNINDINIFY